MTEETEEPSYDHDDLVNILKESELIKPLPFPIKILSAIIIVLVFIWTLIILANVGLLL